MNFQRTSKSLVNVDILIKLVLFLSIYYNKCRQLYIVVLASIRVVPIFLFSKCDPGDNRKVILIIKLHYTILSYFTINFITLSNDLDNIIFR